MSKTISVRMDHDNYEFLHEITREQGSDLSKAVLEMVTRGRVLLAVEGYKNGEASLSENAADFKQRKSSLHLTHLLCGIS